MEKKSKGAWSNPVKDPMFVEVDINQVYALWDKLEREKPSGRRSRNIAYRHIRLIECVRCHIGFDSKLKYCPNCGSAKRKFGRGRKPKPITLVEKIQEAKYNGQEK